MSRSLRGAAAGGAKRLAVRELPDVIAEGAGAVAQLEVAARVGDEGVHLEPISHDAGIAQQALALYGIVAGHRFSIEVVERGTIARALAQDGEPAQARLRALQTQHFEQMTVIMDGHAPLGIMIGDVERIRGAPRAAQLAVRMTLNRCHDPAQSDVQPHGVATTKGLGEIAAGGPTLKTVLDKCPPVSFHELTAIATIDCEAGKWTSHL